MIKKTLLFIVVVLGVYALTLKGQWIDSNQIQKLNELAKTSQAFESSHERSPFATTLALVSGHTVVLTKEQGGFGAPDAGFLNGKYYSFFPPGVSLMILPLYVLGQAFGAGQLFAYMTIPIIMVVCLLLVFVICKRVFNLPARAALSAAITFGFGTTAWSYTITIYQHIPATTLLLLLFYGTYEYGKDVKRFFWWPAVFVLLYGIGMFIDYPNAVLFLPLGFYLLSVGVRTFVSNSKQWLGIRPSLYISFLVIPVVIVGFFAYHQAAFGSWRILHNRLPRYTSNGVEGGADKSTSIAAQKADVSSVFSLSKVPYGVGTFVFSLDRGVFVFSPVLILGILGLLFYSGDRRKEYRTLIAIIVVNVLLYASTGDPWGGWSYGSRYLIPTMGILSIFTGLWVSKGGWRRQIFYSLFVASAGIALLGALTSNLIPPKPEAFGIGLQSNILLNWNLLRANTTGGFVYNTFLAKIISLKIYYVFILSLLSVTTLLVLERLYRKERNGSR